MSILNPKNILVRAVKNNIESVQSRQPLASAFIDSVKHNIRDSLQPGRRHTFFSRIMADSHSLQCCHVVGAWGAPSTDKLDEALFLKSYKKGANEWTGVVPAKGNEAGSILLFDSIKPTTGNPPLKEVSCSKYIPALIVRIPGVKLGNMFGGIVRPSVESKRLAENFFGLEPFHASILTLLPDSPFAHAKILSGRCEYSLRVWACNMNAVAGAGFYEKFFKPVKGDVFLKFEAELISGAMANMAANAKRASPYAILGNLLEQAFQSMEKLAESMLEGLPGKSILQRIAVITGRS
ncbi:MAG: hypothetical protein NT051_05930 [Candidatus Micrarchaeota archaeon]|nr:hypothetical protein [Candidatus Micrarchaeota archaeon]